MIIMKNTIKKILVLCLAGAMAAGAFGCGKGGKTESVRETLSVDDVKTELTFNYKTGAGEDATENDPGEDPQEGDSAAESSAAEAETVIEEVTEIVNVTDADGQDVTNELGEPETEKVVVETREVAAPAESSSSGSENSQSGGQSGSAYVPAYDTCKAYWLDMSKMGDYDFNGQFLTITFEVNDGIPDGSYPVTISATDIASWDLVSFNPKRIDGEVAVNTEVAAQENMPSDDFTLKVNSAAAKQGDQVVVTIDLANNPGFCGFVLDIQYDSNALTIVDATAGSDFNAAINYIP